MFLGLLWVEPMFFLGLGLLSLLLAALWKRGRGMPRVKTAVLTLLLYYYLWVMLLRVVGIPTLREWSRLSQLGEAVFNPKINLIPLGDGFGIAFLLNIFLFIPLGFLCPLVSRTYERPGYVCLAGAGLSLTIELGQLFALHRATDINDLLTNVLGTMVGSLCFRLAGKLRLVKPRAGEKDGAAVIPLAAMVLAYVLGFLS